MRQLDSPAPQWIKNEKLTINSLVRFLDLGPKQWFRVPEHILQSHGFEKASRTLQACFCKQILELSQGSLSHLIPCVDMEDLNRRYRAHFQSIQWSSMQEQPRGLKDSIFQPLTTSRLQGEPPLSPGQRCQNVHVGAGRFAELPCLVPTLMLVAAKKLENATTVLLENCGTVLQRGGQEPSHKRADLYCVASDGAWALDVRVVSGTGQIRKLPVDADKAKMHECGCANGHLLHAVRFIPVAVHASAYIGGVCYQISPCA